MNHDMTDRKRGERVPVKIIVIETAGCIFCVHTTLGLGLWAKDTSEERGKHTQPVLKSLNNGVMDLKGRLVNRICGFKCG